MNRKSEELKEKQISEVMASIENRVRHAYNQGYEQGLIASKQEPCDDAISRQAVIELAKKGVLVSNRNFESVCKAINDLPSVNPQEPKTEQFVKWVASEIFDDNWEYNKDAFAEIACRKLAKLGIVKAKGDEWELVKSQESEVQYE